MENINWEYLNNDQYCILKVAEVIMDLPYQYSSLVYERAKEKYGKELDYTDIRKVANCYKRDRFIANVINEIGKEFKK